MNQVQNNQQQMNINRNMTNDEILAIPAVKKQLDEGKLVIIDMVLTSRPEYTNMYFIGKVEGLPSSNTDVSDLAAQLLGWNNSDIYMRSVQNASTEIANQLQVGMGIQGTIRVIDKLEAEFDGQNPRIDRNNNILLHNKQMIYRTTQICSADELAEKGHETLEVTEKVSQNQPEMPQNNQFQQQSQPSESQAGQGVGGGQPNQANINNLVAGNA